MGRIVFPAELRRTIGLDIRDSVEFYVEGDNIILHKYEPSCTFCQETKSMIRFQGKNICFDCLKKLGKLEV